MEGILPFLLRNQTRIIGILTIVFLIKIIRVFEVLSSNDKVIQNRENFIRRLRINELRNREAFSKRYKIVRKDPSTESAHVLIDHA